MQMAQFGERRMWRKVLGGMLALSLLMTGCAGNADGSGEPAGDATNGTNTDGNGDGDASEPYRIGVLVALTGAYSALGEAEEKSARAFVEQINAQGGINGREVEIEVVDTRSSETDAVSGLRRLADEGVVGVIGPSGTSTSIAVKPTTAELEIPALAMASGTDIVEPIESAEWIFKNFPDISRSTNAMLSFAQGLGADSVAGLAPNNAYGQGQIEALPDRASEVGLEFVGSELHDPDATDFVPQLTVLGDANPNALIVYGVVPASAIIAQNAEQIGMGETQFVFEPGSASQQFIEVGGDSVEGEYVVGTKALVPDTVTDEDPQAEVIRSFASTYQDAHGEAPNQFAGNAWDAMLLMTEALRSAEIDPSDLPAARAALRDALESDLQGFAGVNGIYNYGPDDHSGLGSEGLALLQVQDGQFVLAGRILEDGGVQLVE